MKNFAMDFYNSNIILTYTVYYFVLRTTIKGTQSKLG